MIQVGKDGTLLRDEKKVGWIRDNHIFDYTDKKIGYFVENKIYTIDGKKIAQIDGEFMVLLPADTRIRIEENNKVVMGAISDVARAAIALLLG